MFDIGWGEFVVIAVVALIVIGPKELPAVLRAIGQWTTKIRRMASEFQSQFQEALREAEMADLKKEVDSLNDTARGLTSQFDDPLSFREATKWEPKPDADKPETAKPADAPPDSAVVTPDSHVPPETEAGAPAIQKIPVSADQPAVEQHVPPPAAEPTHAPAMQPAAQPPVPEESGQRGSEGAARS